MNLLKKVYTNQLNYINCTFLTTFTNRKRIKFLFLWCLNDFRTLLIMSTTVGYINVKYKERILSKDKDSINYEES